MGHRYHGKGSTQRQTTRWGPLASPMEFGSRRSNQEISPNQAPKIKAYADDIGIIITGVCPSTLSSIMESTLRGICEWAEKMGLSINADKTDLILFTKRYKVPKWTPPKIGVTRLTPKTQVKYLGTVLECKLAWRPKVVERVKKATIALYTSKKMLSSTWDLSPALMHWIYTSVVRPTLLYGALVWWQATEKTTYTELMERIQRQALVCKTGALNSTATKALETILGIYPIDIHAQLTAGKAAKRLFASGNIVQSAEVKTISFMGPDDWKTGRDQTQHLNIYTDGTKMEGGVGAGLYCTDPEIRLSFKLPNDCSIFQAEVFAIRKAAEVAQNINRPHDVVNLFVNSQAAIRSMQSSTVNSKNVMASREALDNLSTTKSLRIYWVPSHQGIDGNETADVLAKEGVELASDRTENVPVSLRTLQSALEKQADTRAKSRWRNTKTCRISRTMCKERNDKLSQYVLRLPRKDCRLLVGILTGHCLATSHATTLGVLNSRACRKCDESGAIETLEHLICTGITRRRLQQGTRRTTCLRQKHLDPYGYKNRLTYLKVHAHQPDN
ncbi:uncharacterized protein [Drosophila takahashii]|uniref:uncharacterized protein n=1 Tax=Drosophila takahashii TaxID=29030 RepID=UPI003899489F